MKLVTNYTGFAGVCFYNEKHCKYQSVFLNELSPNLAVHLPYFIEKPRRERHRRLDNNNFATCKSYVLALYEVQ